MRYTQLSDDEVECAAKAARDKDPDAEVVAALEREHVELANLPESAHPDEQARRTARLAEIESYLETYRGEG